MSTATMGRRSVRKVLAMAVAVSTLVLVGAVAAAPAQADPANTYRSVPTGRYPIDVDATVDGNDLFVINRGDNGIADLRVYDAASFAELNVVTFGPGSNFNPTAVQVTPDGSQVWVSFYNPGQILVYPLADLVAGASPTPTVLTGGGGFVDLTEDPTGAYIYAATLFNPQYQFSTTDLTAPARTISLPYGSRGVTVDADGTAVYFTQYAPAPAGGVQAVDVAADGSLSTGVFTPTGDLPWGITYSAAANRLLSSNSGNPFSVSGFSPPNGVVNTVAVPCGPRLGDANASGTRAYLACLTGGVLVSDYSVSPPAGHLVPIGGNVEAVDVVSDASGASSRVYATSGASDELLVFDRPTLTSGGDQTITEGQSGVFTAVAANFWETTTWQVSTDGGATWVDVPGADGDSLTVQGTLTDSGNLYRLVATSAFFDPVASEPMLLTVTALPPTPTPTQAPTATASGLAATGTDAGRALLLATVAVVLGTLALLGRRRRV
ncbi:hypothetical protein WDJ51_13525 [Rathayibacter sp. YIM 133350]|uniref:hypothetical protein n=1 Tax=Rathayibacter sp. YIM 133350 TaxID=3131992 RepID=UPI00307DC77E